MNKERGREIAKVLSLPLFISLKLEKKKMPIENENVALESFETFCRGEGLGEGETERFRNFIREKEDANLTGFRTSDGWQELLEEFDEEDSEIEDDEEMED